MPRQPHARAQRVASGGTQRAVVPTCPAQAVHAPRWAVGPGGCGHRVQNAARARQPAAGVLRQPRCGCGIKGAGVQRGHRGQPGAVQHFFLLPSTGLAACMQRASAGSAGGALAQVASIALLPQSFILALGGVKLALRVTCTNTLSEEERAAVIGHHCFRGRLTEATVLYMHTLQRNSSGECSGQAAHSLMPT